MTQGDQANVRSPQQENRAQTTSTATTSGGNSSAEAHNTITINVSQGAITVILVAVVVILLAYVFFADSLLRPVAPALDEGTPTAPPISAVSAERPASATGEEPAVVPAPDMAASLARPDEREASSPQPLASAGNGGDAAAPDAATSEPVLSSGTPSFKPILPGKSADADAGMVRAASVGDKRQIGGQTQIVVGNILVCVPPDVVGRSTIHLWRLAADRNTWEEIPKVSVGSANYNSATGRVKLDGLPVDATSWGKAGQPYRLELWVDSRPVASIGDTAQGQPEFRVYPEQDNVAPDTFCR